MARSGLVVISFLGVAVLAIDGRVVEVRLTVTHNHHPGFPVRASYGIGDALDSQAAANCGAKGVGARSGGHRRMQVEPGSRRPVTATPTVPEQGAEGTQVG